MFSNTVQRLPPVGYFPASRRPATTTAIMTIWVITGRRQYLAGRSERPKRRLSSAPTPVDDGLLLVEKTIQGMIHGADVWRRAG